MKNEMKVDVLAVMDARLDRIREAIRNDNAALVPASYRAGVENLRRDELESTTMARAPVAELIGAATDARDTLHSCIDALSSDEQDDHDALDRLDAALRPRRRCTMTTHRYTAEEMRSMAEHRSGTTREMLRQAAATEAKVVEFAEIIDSFLKEFGDKALNANVRKARKALSKFRGES